MAKCNLQHLLCTSTTPEVPHTSWNCPLQNLPVSHAGRPPRNYTHQTTLAISNWRFCSKTAGFIGIQEEGAQRQTCQVQMSGMRELSSTTVHHFWHFSGWGSTHCKVFTGAWWRLYPQAFPLWTRLHPLRHNPEQLYYAPDAKSPQKEPFVLQMRKTWTSLSF